MFLLCFRSVKSNKSIDSGYAELRGNKLKCEIEIDIRLILKQTYVQILGKIHYISFKCNLTVLDFRINDVRSLLRRFTTVYMYVFISTINLHISAFLYCITNCAVYCAV